MAFPFRESRSWVTLALALAPGVLAGHGDGPARDPRPGAAPPPSPSRGLRPVRQPGREQPQAEAAPPPSPAPSVRKAEATPPPSPARSVRTAGQTGRDNRQAGAMPPSSPAYGVRSAGQADRRQQQAGPPPSPARSARSTDRADREIKQTDARPPSTPAPVQPAKPTDLPPGTPSAAFKAARQLVERTLASRQAARLSPRRSVFAGQPATPGLPRLETKAVQPSVRPVWAPRASAGPPVPPELPRAVRPACACRSFPPVESKAAVPQPRQGEAATPSTGMPAQAVPTPAGPMISRLLPVQGEPGTRVLLAGAGLREALAVTFGGVEARFEPWANWEGKGGDWLEATVPDGAGSGPVRVRTAAGEAASPRDFTVSRPAPVLHGFTPSRAGIMGSVELTGEGLGDTCRVTFWGGLEAAFRVLGPHRVAALVPHGAGPGQILLETPAGRALTEYSFTVEPGPPPAARVDRFVPEAAAPGDLVSLLGSGLRLVQAVTQAGREVPFWIAGQERIVLKASGPLTLRLRTGQTLRAAPPRASGVPGKPAIHAFRAEPEGRATRLRVSGAGLAAVTGASLGGLKAEFVLEDDSAGSLLVPEGIREPAVLVLETPEGEVRSAGLFRPPSPLPEGVALEPASGAPGAPVRIRGRHLDRVTQVLFGGDKAAPVLRRTATELEVRVPAGTATGPIRLRAGERSAIWNSAFTVEDASRALNLRIEALYVTQAVQRPDGSLPLVEGRDGFLRVFPLADRGTLARPSLRVRVYHGERLALERTCPPLAAGIPLRLDEASLAGSWNLALPGELIRRGCAIQAALLPDPGDEDAAVRPFPGEGRRLQLEVRPAAGLKVTLFPIVCRGTRGRVADELRPLSAWAGFASQVLPVAGLELRQGPAFTVQLDRAAAGPEGLDFLLEALRAKRVADPPGDRSRRYFGVFHHGLFEDHALGGVSFIGRPGRLTTRVGLGWDHPEGSEHRTPFDRTFAHELGHGLGLGHPFPEGDAPCGYPHPECRTGACGFDVRSGRPQSARMKDFMSYFAGSSLWVSDHHWAKMAEFLEDDAAGAAAEAPAAALMVWGQMRDGKMHLRPALRVSGEHLCPPPDGPFRLQGLDPDGRVLVEAAFAVAGREGQGAGGDGSFLFTLPLDGKLEQALAALRVAGPEPLEPVERRAAGAGNREPACARLREGAVTLEWDHRAWPMVAVKAPGTGEILALGWESPLELESAEEELELALSDGVRTRVERVVVR